MGEIVLVRHGQANSAATDEADYDRLSDLGRTQAKWLGQWLGEREAPFDRTLCGSLRRHRQTALAMGIAETALHVDDRLNELDYFNLTQALRDNHGVPLPEPHEFADYMPRVMEAWHRAEIMGQESFANFETRVTEALLEAATEGVRVLCVTSAGVIGMVVRHLLDLDPRRMAHILLPIRNSSIHRITVENGQMLLTGFNATPHLDTTDRAHARTTY